MVLNQFPILEIAQNRRLIYLDSAATSLKPQVVINSQRNYESEYSANIHRGIYKISERATLECENVRKSVLRFINAKSLDEIIFTTGTTEGINIVAYSYASYFLSPGDEIWISSLEHHSNIVPWQIICKRIGCLLKLIPLNYRGDLKFTKKTKILAVTYASNVLGVFNPIKKWIQQARSENIVTLIDAAQAVSHIEIDVQELDCDFLVFSGHKMYGPTGIGILYGKQRLLDKMQPYKTGGGMIQEVGFYKTTYAPLPLKFEAGTPNISGIIGLGSAIQFLIENRVKLNSKNLANYARNRLLEIPDLILFGDFQDKLPIWSFMITGIHPHDISSIIDLDAICIRAGNMCAQPLMKLLNVRALVRVSLGIYNTEADIDSLIIGLFKVKQVFKS